MKYFYFSALLLLSLFSTALAQTTPEPSVEKKQFAYHFLTNFSYEAGIGRTNTIRVSGPLTLGLYYETQANLITGESHSESYYYLSPTFSSQFRHYYNLNKRAEQGKRVDKNSGNFIAPIVKLYGPALTKSGNVDVPDFMTALGAVWGIQRNYGKSFNFQLDLGPGIVFVEGEAASFAPIAELSLGFRIGK